MLKLKIDNRIHADVNELPGDILEMLVEALTIDNLAKKKAKDQKVWAYRDMPDEIELYGTNGDEITMPLGFMHNLAVGLDALDVDFKIIDNRTYETGFRIGNKPTLEFYQEPAYDAMRDFEVMIYQGPTGSGKTVTALYFARMIAQRTCVIVNTKKIAEQWIERAREHLGPHYPTAMIGDGKFDVSKRLTVATAQTLWSRREELIESGFFKQFGAVILDETHHVTADTFAYILDLFTARYRIGLSATPGKTGDFRVAQAVMGPVKHITTDEELRQAGRQVKPKIIQVRTNFDYPLHGNISFKKRSNYPQMLEAMVNDPERNWAIIEVLLRDRDRYNLVLSKRLEHLDRLAEMLRMRSYLGNILFLTSREKKAARERLDEMIATEEPFILFSTLADEALDIAILDRIHLAFPQKNDGLIVQQLGRGLRPHPKKREVIAYDWADTEIPQLESQWRNRWQKVYKHKRLSIERTAVDEILKEVA